MAKPSRGPCNVDSSSRIVLASNFGIYRIDSTLSSIYAYTKHNVELHHIIVQDLDVTINNDKVPPNLSENW